MDPELQAHFASIDAGELIFCHRWMLLSFRREFPLADALRVFEILCSHHLEVSSLTAESARQAERRRHTAETKGAVVRARARGRPGESFFLTRSHHFHPCV
jgi:hypothetical protein